MHNSRFRLFSNSYISSSKMVDTGNDRLYTVELIHQNQVCIQDNYHLQLNWLYMYSSVLSKHQSLMSTKSPQGLCGTRTDCQRWPPKHHISTDVGWRSCSDDTYLDTAPELGNQHSSQKLQFFEQFQMLKTPGSDPYTNSQIQWIVQIELSNYIWTRYTRVSQNNIDESCKVMPGR